MDDQQRREYRARYIPQHFLDARLSDFSPAVRGDLEEIADKQGLYCWGPVGIGKTHLLAALANDLLIKGALAVWTTLETLCCSLRSVYQPESNANEEKIFSVVLEAEHLFLDDLGTCYSDAARATDFSHKVLYRVLDTRVHKDLPTYISSNKPPLELEKHFDERIGSRLHMLHILPLKGPDLRRTKG